MSGLWDKILYSAPVFAPLLFANLAVLGVLGLWGLLRRPGAAGSARIGADYSLRRRGDAEKTIE
jgi:hypothetical protein